MARITVGYNDNGTPIYKALDYFAKREDALICLAQYNDAPYLIDYRNITFEQLYAKLKEIKFPGMSSSLKRTLNAAYNYCEPLYSLRYRSIKAYQMQRCIDACPKSYATKANIKNLFWHLDRLAFELDVISKRYSETLTVQTGTPKERTTFTDAEVQELWQHKGEPGIDGTLFMLYTGMRISEMLSVKTADVNLVEGYLRGGVKTAAGKDRLVPIHPEINELVSERMGGELLFPEPHFRKLFAAAIKNHLPHDCRHTFRSKLDSAGANKVAIDLIMGHKSSDVGERVYTHKTVQELRDAVSLLSYGK